MARQPRQFVAGGIYHVYARGNDRRPIFLDDADRRAYLSILAEATTRCGWQRLAHCLMGNHVHLLLETPILNLSQGMHRLQGIYAQRFNRRHGRSGHLFQDRFKAVQIESDRQFVAVTNYIAMNPVKAKLTKAPELWEWLDCSNAEERIRAMYGPTKPAVAIGG